MEVTDHPDGDKAIAAYDARTDALTDTSPRPWTPFEEHGCDISDEGWSTVGVKAGDGVEVAIVYTAGFENSTDPWADAGMVAAAVNTYEPALTLARTFAPCEEFAAAAAVLGISGTVGGGEPVDAEHLSGVPDVHDVPRGGLRYVEPTP